MERRPFTNWLMLMAMTAIFFWQVSQPPETTLALCLNGFFSKGLLSHMWIHGGLMHLLGNMLFLWIFGNAVCYKLGNLLYLPAFVILGLASALAYSIFNSGPMLGASGAINGVVGMFLVLFPTNDITCLWMMFPFVRKFSLSSYWMILFWLAFDIFGAINGQGMVAYWAHLGGFFGGFALAWVLLKIKYIKMTRFERSLLDIIEQRGKPASQTSSQNYADYLDQQQAYDDQPEPENQHDTPKIPTPIESKTLVKEVIRFECFCGKIIKTHTKNAGKKGRCPKCRTPIQVPQP